MPKQSSNPLWDYFKVYDEDASKVECILCKKSLFSTKINWGSKLENTPLLVLHVLALEF